MRQSVSDVSGNADIMHTSYYTNTNSIAPQNLYETGEKSRMWNDSILNETNTSSFATV